MSQGKSRQVRKAEQLASMESLMELALAVDRLHQRLGSTSDSSDHDAWQALLRGQARIVHRFERGGRRYLLLRKDGGAARGSLSEREAMVFVRRVQGASFKVIATEAGTAVSTAAYALERAMAKLGVRSQAELVHLFSRSG